MMFPTPISVVIGTYGDRKWFHLAEERAKPSAENQTMEARDIILNHGKTLAEARNMGAQKSRGEYIIFLDADDELDPHYIESMTNAIDVAMTRSDYFTFLYQPATLGIVDGVEDDAPVMIPEKPINTGNYLVIGTMMSQRLFKEVGGFHEWKAYEDWDLFWRCMKKGAGVYEVPEAIYRVHVNPKGRNSLSGKEARKVFAAIQRENAP